jgi:signal recognition particle receptor subunit beta
MVFFNYATMQMAAKIVYYGPGLCGKTTNLHYIYGRTAPGSRGEMVSLETETDRTLFFDLLPLDVGIISGFKTRLQLYTVPGQVFYNTTRKLVLKGVDGIVFVADSQIPMAEPNRESLKNLRENLAEIGLSLESIPHVFQYNKRDLSNILSVDSLNDLLNAERTVEWYEASATNGPGVFETLKAISKLTLRSLKSKMTVEGRRSSVSGIVAIPAVTSAASALSSSAFMPALKDPETAPRDRFDSTLTRLERFREFQDAKEKAEFAGTEGARPSPPPPEIPFIEATKPPGPPLALVPDESSTDVRFAEVKTPEAPPVSETAVRHVRVRSSVDILSELEKLRKLSTQKPPLSGTESAPRPRSSASLSLDDLLSGTRNHRKDVAQSFELTLPKDALGKSRKATVTLRFQDDTGGEVAPETTVSIDLANVRAIQKLLLSLKFNVHGK